MNKYKLIFLFSVIIFSIVCGKIGVGKWEFGLLVFIAVFNFYLGVLSYERN